MEEARSASSWWWKRKNENPTGAPETTSGTPSRPSTQADLPVSKLSPTGKLAKVTGMIWTIFRPAVDLIRGTYVMGKGFKFCADKEKEEASGSRMHNLCPKFDNFVF